MSGYAIMTQTAAGKGRTWIQFSENQKAAEHEAARHLMCMCPADGEQVAAVGPAVARDEREAGVFRLAERMQAQQGERCHREYGESADGGNWHSWHVYVKRGRKYINVDLGGSGKYMVTGAGGIYGIKAYGVIHHGYYFGTLATIQAWDWSGYRATQRPAA